MNRSLVLFLIFPLTLIAQETQSIDFANSEKANFSATDGLIYYDMNFYPDHSEFSTDGGGLSVYSGDDGWGAIFDTNNMKWLTPTFEGLDITSSNNNKVRFNSNDTPSISFIPNNGNSHFHISHTLDNRLTISQGGYVGASILVTIVNNGDVGIGTSSPDSRLAVNGMVHAKEVKVDLTGWPDYVFTDNHDLPTLDEVERHIKEKGHLSNMPSAKEVEANGIQLGEMNKLLLEKIEELTLYILAQDKEIKSLKANNQKIDELKKEMAAMKKVIVALNQNQP
ncbi:hypothetical protein [Flagellimonas lutimaris]|uniref:hypothetical protein n=1 Tax=Flagellimonas lutimaris TaxID=475082 RepID=UPI003F5CE8E6